METTKSDVKMYMAIIQGWTEVTAFSTDLETAKDLAVKKKQSLCRDDLSVWTWDSVSEYYGAFTEEITDGFVIVK